MNNSDEAVADCDRRGSKRRYVQFGCGLQAPEGWLNFDNSPTLRVQRLPVVGRALSALATGRGAAFPRNVLHGDICRGLPIENHSAHGVYASHVLEHLSFADVQQALSNVLRLLMPGGIFRLIVPDFLARARRYVREADAGDATAASRFLRSSFLGKERRAASPLAFMREAIGGSAHLWMWDEISIAQALRTTGFVSIRRCALGDCSDEMFHLVEDESRFYDAKEEILECAIEARAPGA
jgi:SAM-dependent methyltransferase